MFCNSTPIATAAVSTQPFKDGVDQGAFWGYNALSVPYPDLLSNSPFDYGSLQAQQQPWDSRQTVSTTTVTSDNGAVWANSSAGSSANPSLSPVTPPHLYSSVYDGAHNYLSVCMFPFRKRLLSCSLTRSLVRRLEMHIPRPIFTFTHRRWLCRQQLS